MADRRVERREHFGVGQHRGPGEAVEERRFPRVGVPDQCDGRERDRLPLLPLRGPASAHALQAAFDRVDALVDAPAVGLELGFTGTARADTAAQTRHGGSVPGQARQ